MPTTQDADVIIIGSGMGGLTAGALLARLHGRKVVLLERHFRPGGFTHTFSRPGGFSWDVGVHYVGELEAPGLIRQALQVATGGALQWAKMPQGYDVLRFPGFEFTVREGEANYRADLEAAFPRERAAIARYFRDLRRAVGWAPMLGMRGLAPWPVFALARFFMQRGEALVRMTTGQWLEQHVRDEKLRAVLAARWGDYGEPPRTSSFLTHAIVMRHYFEGAFYPVGGAGRIAQTCREVIEAAGGSVRVNSEVSEIVLEGGRAVGARLRKTGQVLRAPVVISNAGARATYLRLLPPEVVPFRDEVDQAPVGMGHLSLYLGFSESPAKAGATAANCWVHDGLDPDRLFERRGELLEGVVPHASIFFPSLKDPSARVHTAEIIAPIDVTAFAAWAGTRWMKRGAEYLELKERLSNALLAFAEREFPGLSKLVVTRELSTPLSTEHFTGHRGGEIYGLPATPSRFSKPYLSVRSPVPGLFLAGADAFMLGIGGAVVSAVFCAAAVEGLAVFPRLGRAASALPSPVWRGDPEATAGRTPHAQVVHS